jgi:hypothetical protein
LLCVTDQRVLLFGRRFWKVEQLRWEVWRDQVAEVDLGSPICTLRLMDGSSRPSVSPGAGFCGFTGTGGSRTLHRRSVSIGESAPVPAVEPSSKEARVDVLRRPVPRARLLTAALTRSVDNGVRVVEQAMTRGLRPAAPVHRPRSTSISEGPGRGCVGGGGRGGRWRVGRVRRARGASRRRGQGSR